jgi:hypothetical protein
VTPNNERLELFIQGAIAMVVVLGVVTVAVAEAVLNHPIQVPDMLAFAMPLVLGFFFGSRAVKQGGTTATNGMLTVASKMVEQQQAVAANQERTQP